MVISSPKALANATRNQRKQQKLSQNEVADRVGLKQTTLSAFENNPAGTRLDTLFRILSALDLEMQIIPKQTSGTDERWEEEW